LSVDDADLPDTFALCIIETIAAAIRTAFVVFFGSMFSPFLAFGTYFDTYQVSHKITKIANP
jgi:hypothetical protein